MIYVSHCFGGKKKNMERARRVTHDLATADTENTYVCPLLCFNYLRYNELGYENEMRLCTDLLGECEKMIVASEISRGVQLEIDYCNEWDIPVEYRIPTRKSILTKIRRAIGTFRFSLWLKTHKLFRKK